VKLALLILVGLLVLLQAGVRLWPVRPEDYHQPITPEAFANVRFCPEPGTRFAIVPASLEPLIAAASAEPRTRILAGSAAEGRVTLVSRSLIWGFPDVTTAEVTPQGLCIISRQVIGSNDWGQNAKRLNRWLETAYGINPEL
jgi:hypothetical protein